MKLADQIFQEVVHSNSWMTPEQVELCRAESLLSDDSSLALDVSRRRGYLDDRQVETVKNSIRYFEVRREDDEIAKEVARRKLANAEVIASALKIQKKRFEAGKHVPRLLHILERSKVITSSHAFAIQGAFEEQASSSGEFVTVKDTLGTAERRAVDRRESARFPLDQAKVDVRSSGIFRVVAPGCSWRDATLVDISVTGCQLIVPFEVKTKTRLHVSLVARHLGSPIKAKGVAKWVRSFSRCKITPTWCSVRDEYGDIQRVKRETKYKETLYRIGLEFVAISEDDKAQLDYLSKMNAQSANAQVAECEELASAVNDARPSGTTPTDPLCRKAPKEQKRWSIQASPRSTHQAPEPTCQSQPQY